MFFTGNSSPSTTAAHSNTGSEEPHVEGARPLQDYEESKATNYTSSDVVGGKRHFTSFYVNISR